MRSDEPQWLTPDEVVELNAAVVGLSQEPHFLRDRGLLESAVARPQNLWAYGENDTLALAVAILGGIARNHPFEQGNKRTAFAAMELFLEINGYTLEIVNRTDVGEAVEDVVTGGLSEWTFAELLRPHVRALGS